MIKKNQNFKHKKVLFPLPRESHFDLAFERGSLYGILMKIPTLLFSHKYRFLSALFSIFLLKPLAFAQTSFVESPTQPRVQAVPLELPALEEPAEEATDQKTTVIVSVKTPGIKLVFESPFNPQFGLGLTGIFAQGLWGLPEGNGIYHGGFQINFLWRVHPRVTLELSGGGVFSNRFAETGERLSEAVLSPGVRVFLTMPKDNRVKFFQILPYVTAGPELTALYPQIHYESTTVGPNSVLHIERTYPLLYMGGHVGLGVEMRLSSYVALTLDAKFLAQGAIDFWGDSKQHSPARLGVRGSFGLAFYLP